uniref:Uncharacterized protein n=1 Tax=Trepomonas sp. PC1 TaxID=1076344 RepID=A0A146K5J6_9EUKA|eukprot:JAP90831.1 hypothetical protein TPC1_17754 [Trepomonas sp. PC1]
MNINHEMHFQAITIAGSPITGSIDGPLSKASFSRPCSIIKHDKFIFVSDRSINNSIRVIFDGQVKSLRWKSSSELLHAAGLCVFRNCLFIVDKGHDKIRYLQLPALNQLFFNSLETTRFDICTLQTPALKKPGSIIVKDDQLIVSDSGSGRVLQFVISEKLDVLQAIELAKLGRPEGMCLWGDSVLVADSLLNQIFEVSTKVKRVFGGENSEHKFKTPCGICVYQQNIFILERDSCSLLLLKGSELTKISSRKGYCDGEDFAMDEPSGLFCYMENHQLKILIADTKNAAIREVIWLKDQEEPVVQIIKQSLSQGQGQSQAQSQKEEKEQDLIPLLKIAPSSTLDPLLVKSNVQIEPFWASFNQIPFKPDQCCQMILKAQHDCFYPVSFSFLDYFHLIDEFWDLSRLSDLEVKNLKALQIYRTFCIYKLLNYEPQLLQQFIKSPEQHSALISLVAGRCVKIRCISQNQILKINPKNQFLAGKIDFSKDSQISFQIDLQISLPKAETQIQIAFVDGILQDEKVYYLEGELQEFMGRQISVFSHSFKYQLPKAVLENAWMPKQNPVIRMEIKAGEEGFMANVDFGTGQEKKVQKELQRVYMLEQESVATRV